MKMRKSLADRVENQGLDNVITAKKARIEYLESMEAPDRIIEVLRRDLKQLEALKGAEKK